jgi:hypothetical protein
MTIEVLGLGESLSEYKPNGNTTIGVNDIHSRIKTDYVVCVDNFEPFTKERLEVILNTKCKGFYSQLECWRNISNFKRIELHRLAKLTDEKFRYSNNSTFVACVLAYKLGATKIILWGVDMNTHKHFVGNSFDKAINDFKQLKKDLNQLGCELVIGSKISALYKILTNHYQQ